MDMVVDQVLEKLLSERDKVSRLERSLQDQRHTVNRIGDLIESEDSDSDALIQSVQRLVDDRARLQGVLADYEAIEILLVREAVARSLVAMGLGGTGNLRVDTENLARLLEAGRPLPSSIL
jgi:hypothetical protein